MFGRRFCDWNFHEMNQTPIVILIALFIASAHIQNILVVANEQQQAEQLGKTKKKFDFIHLTARDERVIKRVSAT